MLSNNVPNQYKSPLEAEESQPENVEKGLLDNKLEEKRIKLFEKGSQFKKTTRDELVGIEGELRQIDEIIDALRHADVYAKYGARLEPGLLLSGAPGTGKTTSARYLASASEAKFINVRDWPHQNALLTDRDIKDLFAMAREFYAQDKKPIILFWDEFEGVAVDRTKASAEVAAVVSQLTSELDGICGKNTGVLLIGCTNYSHLIDEALTRSGRMGVEIEFSAPDTLGKAKLLEYYLEKYSRLESIDIESLALCFHPRACAAEIEEACQHAWRYAVSRSIKEDSQPMLSQEDLQHVFLERLIGAEASYTNISVEEKMAIANHELGHAFCALAVGIPVSLITVRAGEYSLGKVITRPRRDHTTTLNDLHRNLVVGFGGIAAGDFCGFPRITGMASDLDNLNILATQLVEEYAHVGWFLADYVSDARGQGRHPDVSPEVVARNDKAITELLEKSYKMAMECLQGFGKENFLQLGQWMVAKTTITAAELEQHLKKEYDYSIPVLEEFTKD